MKIILATGIFPPEIGGPAFYAKRLAEEFSKRGHSAAVITYGGNFKKSPDYEIIGVSRRWPYGIRQSIYFLKLLNLAGNSDAIFAFDSLGAGLPAVIAGKLLGRKVLIRLGGDFLWEKFFDSGMGTETMNEFYDKKLDEKFSLLKRLITFSLRNSEAAFTTEYQRNLFVKHYGLDIRKTAVIGNIFEKENKEIFQYQQKPKIILWTGRFIKLKNLDLLLRVFKRLLERDSNLILELAGEGPEYDDLRRKADELGVKDKVLFSGNLGDARIFEEIKKSYFCILPSLSEVSPNFALRCLSFNKPIVLTEECGIKKEFPGLMYANPKNEDSFYSAALRLLDKNIYDNYQKFIAGIRYRKTWQDLADEYLGLLEVGRKAED